MIGVLLIGVGCLAASWALMIVLAARLPPGILKDLAGLWVISPIDLIPEFLPVIGPLDDIVVVALAFRYAARQSPTEVLYDAWPADPDLLRRLLGARRPPAGRQ